MNCGVGHRCGLDPSLLWLWCRLAAVAPIGSLAWEITYVTGGVLKKKKKIFLPNLLTRPSNGSSVCSLEGEPIREVTCGCKKFLKRPTNENGLLALERIIC